MTQIEVLQEISQTLISINDCLEGINVELEDISMANKMMIFSFDREARNERQTGAFDQ